MYNAVTLVGRLGNAPEIRYTQSQKAVASFSIATSEGKNQPTEWHRIVAWEKTAELCGQYLSKGSLVMVIGRIASRKYEDKQGNERVAYEIVANRVVFLSPKSETHATEFGSDQFPSAATASSEAHHEPSLEDIPF